MSIKAAIYATLQLKQEKGVGDRAADLQAFFTATKLLPDGNCMPRSLHLMKGALNVPSAKSFERHICRECYHRFPELQPDAWHLHQDDQCQNCERKGKTSLRFKVSFCACQLKYIYIIFIYNAIFWTFKVSFTVHA